MNLKQELANCFLSHQTVDALGIVGTWFLLHVHMSGHKSGPQLYVVQGMAASQ